MEYFSVYDQFGEKTGAIIERKEAHQKGICHRVFHLWIANENNQVLIQQRSANKDAGANLWYVSVGGHVQHNESIQEAIIRETGEELGLDISGMMDEVKYLFSFRETLHDHDGAYVDDEFFDVFVLKNDFTVDQLRLQEEEVQAAKYVDYDRFRQLILQKDTSFWQHEIAYPMLALALDHHFTNSK